MPVIEFTQLAEVRGAEARTYQPGERLECSEGSAERWLRRGVARLVDEKKKGSAKPSEPKPPG